LAGEDQRCAHSGLREAQQRNRKRQIPASCAHDSDPVFGQSINLSKTRRLKRIRFQEASGSDSLVVLTTIKPQMGRSGHSTRLMARKSALRRALCCPEREITGFWKTMSAYLAVESLAATLI